MKSFDCIHYCIYSKSTFYCEDMDQSILILSIMTSIALLILLFNTVRNAIIFNHVHSIDTEVDANPLVSVLVPARNEEDII